MSGSIDLEQIIERVGDLPAVPEVVSEVLTLTENPNIDLPVIAEVIQKDPALSAKVLRISNSPYYGMRQYVGTLKLALVILGVREVRNIVLGICVFDTLRNRKTESLLAEGFWRHSFVVAALSKKLGEHLGLSLHGEDFITGLLHDIGKLVLMRQFPGEYSKIYTQGGGGGESLCAVEQEGFGFTHADVAAALATLWNFPQTLIDGLLLHHPKENVFLWQAKDPRLAAIVRIANMAAHEDANSLEASGEHRANDREAWDILTEAVPGLSEEEYGALLAGCVRDVASLSLPPL
jgi:HD-like signal output (HDOD) protein